MDKIKEIIKEIIKLPQDKQIERINKIKIELHKISPFKNEPVDCVLWVKGESVIANDYNPNKVAPPEMELLEISIMNDGYTQPIVSWDNPEKGVIEVIDGFHRNRIGKESKIVKKRTYGYLPITNIRKTQSKKNDRIASTIRHNRARGKHQIDAMSEIVIELKNRNWTNKRISRELGMDEEEVLRLCQISGLEHLFSDKDFNRAWTSSDDISNNYEILSDELTEEEINKFRTLNTNDNNRIFHTFDKWECHKSGFYKSKKDGMTTNECEQEYYNILSNSDLFKNILNKIIIEWKHSCEHYLTNTSMNRIAWLGQAAVCYKSGVPSKYCSGWNLLSNEEQNIANTIALNALNKWLKQNNRNLVSMEEASSIGRQIEIY